LDYDKTQQPRVSKHCRYAATMLLEVSGTCFTIPPTMTTMMTVGRVDGFRCFMWQRPLFLTHNRTGDKYFGFWARPYVTDLLQTTSNINSLKPITLLVYYIIYYVRSNFNYLPIFIYFISLFLFFFLRLVRNHKRVILLLLYCCTLYFK